LFYQVAFLSAIVGSGVAAAAAQAAISAQSQVDMSDSLVDSSISSTKEEGSNWSLAHMSVTCSLAASVILMLHCC
jgi:hypothetical protein